MHFVQMSGDADNTDVSAGIETADCREKHKLVLELVWLHVACQERIVGETVKARCHTVH